MKFKESAIAHKYLDGLVGIEIGGSAHNPFGLNTLNVDFTDDMTTIFKDAEEQICGERLNVDIVAPGDDIPLENESYDFVVNSHVIEHIFNPIAALREWKRIIKSGGYILSIVPIKELTPGETRGITTFQELLDRDNGLAVSPMEVFKDQHKITDIGGLDKDTIISILNTHHTVFDIPLYQSIIDYIEGFELIEIENPDLKVGNGFLMLHKKL
jgi:SAM-dependent methyltransferase